MYGQVDILILDQVPGSSHATLISSLTGYCWGSFIARVKDGSFMRVNGSERQSPRSNIASLPELD